MEIPTQHAAGSANIPTATRLQIALGLVAATYLAIAGFGLYVYQSGGITFSGDAHTLTSVLAGIGVFLGLVNAIFIAKCKQAGLNRVARHAIEGSVSLRALHRMDVAVRGGLLESASHKSWLGYWFNLILPVLGLLMSATIKKSLNLEEVGVGVTVSGSDSSLSNPTNVGNLLRASAWSAAILLNTTMSFTRTGDSSQTTWSYISPGIVDNTGLHQMPMMMPSLPKVIADGRSGYIDYLATNVPSLLTNVQCSNVSYTALPQASINNGDNEIELSNTEDGSPWIQISTKAGLQWSCLAQLFTTDHDTDFASDTNGIWNISNFNTPYASSDSSASDTAVAFTTTPVRWNMMADIISDALGSTAANNDWSWTTSTSDDTGYSAMLSSTRLAFGAAVLAFSETKPVIDISIETTASATISVQKIKILANWALVVTILISLVQAVGGFVHAIDGRRVTFDFGILQIAEMQQTAQATDLACQLQGNCPRRQEHKHLQHENQQIGFRAHAGHLALVRVNGENSVANINIDVPCRCAERTMIPTHTES